MPHLGVNHDETGTSRDTPHTQVDLERLPGYRNVTLPWLPGGHSPVTGGSCGTGRPGGAGGAAGLAGLRCWRGCGAGGKIRAPARGGRQAPHPKRATPMEHRPGSGGDTASGAGDGCGGRGGCGQRDPGEPGPAQPSGRCPVPFPKAAPWSHRAARRRTARGSCPHAPPGRCAAWPGAAHRGGAPRGSAPREAWSYWFQASTGPRACRVTGEPAGRSQPPSVRTTIAGEPGSWSGATCTTASWP
jgi:hypothetical protein